MSETISWSQLQEDDSKPNDYVRVAFAIAGLKRKSGHNAQPKNGNIKLTLTPRSFHLVVLVTGGSSYECKKENLVEEISDDPEKTYWKMNDDGTVILMLNKKTPASWLHHINSGVISLDDE